MVWMLDVLNCLDGMDGLELCFSCGVSLDHMSSGISYT